jgi:flagellum-specific peptidoglycan hydrolase FlgJ
MLQKKGKLPEFPNSQETGEPLVLPKAVTGLEGIGRGDDMNKLTEFLTLTQQVLGPEIAQQYVNYEEALRRLAASASIDTTNLVKTSEQLQQEAAAAQAQQQQDQQQQQMMEMMKSSAASKVADNFTQPGSPYGPQFSGNSDNGAAGSIPNSLPDLRAAAQGLPSGPVQGGGEG